MAGDLVARGGNDLDAAGGFAEADHGFAEGVGGFGQRRGGAFHRAGGVGEVAGGARDDLAGFVEPLVMGAERMFGLVQPRGQAADGCSEGLDHAGQAGGGFLARGRDDADAFGHLRARIRAGFGQGGSGRGQGRSDALDASRHGLGMGAAALFRRPMDAVERLAQGGAHVAGALFGGRGEGGGQAGDFQFEGRQRRRHAVLALLHQRGHAPRRLGQFVGAAADLAAEAAFDLGEFARHGVERAEQGPHLRAEGVEMTADPVLPQGAEGRARAFRHPGVGLADARAHGGDLVAQRREGRGRAVRQRL